MPSKGHETASWRGLIYRLDQTLQGLGVRLPKKDLHLLGDLQFLDASCQALPKMIESLVDIQPKPEEWERLGDLVARLKAELGGLKRSATRSEAPLGRLLTAICAVRSPRKHLESLSAGSRPQLKRAAARRVRKRYN